MPAYFSCIIMKKTFITCILALFAFQFSIAQQRMDNSIVINGFITMSMDNFLDSIARQHNLKIIFNREEIGKQFVAEHFFNEPLKGVLANICRSSGYRYWLEGNGTIYILKTQDELLPLKKLARNTLVNPVLTQTIVQQRAEIKEPIVVRKGPFNISGKVIDKASGETLPGAVIRIAYTDLSATSNADGYFTILNVPTDTCTVITSYIGYQTDRFELRNLDFKNLVTINMFPSSNNLSEVVITDKKTDGVMTTDTRRVSVLQISPAKLNELPNIGEKDILRSFQLMPGISASNESSSGAYVRGGTPDQNLVLFDGFTIYQVDHLYGFFSAFNSNAVKDVQLYKGGFSSKFGGRLSSVTDISGKEGNKKNFSLGTDLSLLSANIFLETPVTDNSSLLLAYRRSYQGPLYNKLFNQFNNTSTLTQAQQGPGGPGGRGGAQAASTPISYFYDLNAKYTYRHGEKDIFSWSFYQGNDNLDNSREINLPSFITGNGGGIKISDLTDYGNLGSSAKWSRFWGSKLYSNTLVSYSTYKSNRDRSNKSTVTDTAGFSSEISRGTVEKNMIEDFSLKSDWEWQGFNKVKLLFGGFTSQQNLSFNYQSDSTMLIDQYNKALTGGAYAEAELNPNEQLQFKAGLRSTYYGKTGRFYVEPRLSGTYSLSDQLTLKAAGGRFYQFANRVLREDILSGSRDFWVLSDGDAIPVGAANHYIGGLSYETGGFLFDAEVYYKKLNGLTEYSQRQSPNPRSRTIEEHFYNGQGFSRGVELLAQKKTGNFTGWLSYTLAEAKNQFDTYGEEYYYANQDNRHEFKSVNMYRWKKWTFSATWILASGRPYTAPTGSYSLDNMSGIRNNYLTISGKNTERLPAYHRLDAALTMDILKVDSRKAGTIGLSLFNIYNRKNTWYKEYSIQDNQVITSDINYLGFTPNITLSIKWK